VHSTNTYILISGTGAEGTCAGFRMWYLQYWLYWKGWTWGRQKCRNHCFKLGMLGVQNLSSFFLTIVLWVWKSEIQSGMFGIDITCMQYSVLTFFTYPDSKQH